MIQLSGIPQDLVRILVKAAGRRRVALVGGAVRDLLLHKLHHDPWRGLPDLDLVVEATPEELADPASAPLPAPALAHELRRRLGCEQVPALREHGRFGTVEMDLLLPEAGAWMLDLASARRETYPAPAENPQVHLGSLDDDLARRDFSVNAMALLLNGDGRGLELLDPHGGQIDLAARQLRFLHADSLRDDPTRLFRAARYAARLGFALDPSTQIHVQRTLASWPWDWRIGDPPELAPPALGTRLRMELELLLEREPWVQALSLLRSWGGLTLLDPGIQADQHWRRRLRWAERLSIPPLLALLAAAEDGRALAARLQLPHGQQLVLGQWLTLRDALPDPVQARSWAPSRWCSLLEAQGHGPMAVALAVVAGHEPRSPLLRWWFRWRHVKAPMTAADWIAAGVAPGPELGRRLALARYALLDEGFEAGRRKGPGNASSETPRERGD